MWSDDGWKRVTAEQAAKLHPGGTVSAKSGLFMCELCGQYVTLTDSISQTRHFRHSAKEKSKNCPERTHEVADKLIYSPQKYDLPIRIVDVTSSSFRFELGLIYPQTSLPDTNFRIEIKPEEKSNESYIFSKERLNNKGITYLPIGEQPYKKYILHCQLDSDKLCEFWPTEIEGIDPEGTFFEKDSGRRLPYDSDIKMGQEYYLLTHKYSLRKTCKSVRLQECAKKKIGWRTWTLYIVSALEFDEEAAKFYLRYHCRLTRQPVSLKPVWPLFVENNHIIIKQIEKSMYILVEGNISAVQTFPQGTVNPLTPNDSASKLYEIISSRRQKLISAGRAQTLQYTYFWEEPLNQVGTRPKISVTDLDGCEIDSGETDILPKNGLLYFNSIFDGDLLILKNNYIIDKRKITSEKYIELNRLSFGTSVQFRIGLDIVWSISFKKQKCSLANNDFKILERITNVSGVNIPTPHSLRNILVGMSHYPQICYWIRKCIKKGTINEQAYRRLQDFYREMNIKK